MKAAPSSLVVRPSVGFRVVEPASRGALTVALVLTGCGATLGGSAPDSAFGTPSSPSAPSSGASGSASSFSSSSSEGPPTSPGVSGDLVVRPDLLVVDFRFKAKAINRDVALAALRAAAEDTTKRVKAGTGGQAVVIPRTFQLAAAPHEKMEGDEAGAEPVVATVEGRIEIPLGEALDYWSRARLLSMVETIVDDIHRSPLVPVATEQRRGAELKATFAAPRPAVKNVEAYRAALVEIGAKRAKALAAAMQDPTAPLAVVDCAPPQPIQEQPLGLEQVSLSLRLDCRVGLAAVPSAVTADRRR